MKYVIIRCEDTARGGEQTAALLEGAQLAHLAQLSQAGSAGLFRPHDPPGGVQRLHLHRAMFGLEPDEPNAAPGHCYAAEAGIQLAPEDTAWCCDLVTHRDGRIIDATAGQIPTKESQVLLGALNEALGSDTRRWAVGSGSRHVLIVRDARLQPPTPFPAPPPDRLLDQAWSHALPRGPAGDALRELIQAACRVLEDHPINRVRVDLGENPANLIWCWGPSVPGAAKTFADRTGLGGVVVSSSFPMRGLANRLGVEGVRGPERLEEASVRRLAEEVAVLIVRRDVVYVHLQIDSADPVERLCAMERIDQHLLKPLTERLPSLGPWRLLAAVDDRSGQTVPFVAIGTDLPPRPVARLTMEELLKHGLVVDRYATLFEWFIGSKP